MEDLPYPGVDLQKCKPKLKDDYPLSLVDYMENLGLGGENDFFAKYKDLYEEHFMRC